MSIKAVIFDMDGVLIDAKEWHYEALNRALSLFGMEINRYEHLSSYDGLPTKKKLEMVTIEKGLPEELHRFINELKQEYTMETVYSKCKPSFNHRYALSKLKQEGYKLAVASNSIKNTIDIMMKKSGLIEYIEFCLSNEDVIYPKPSSEIYDKAIDKLGLKPSECLIVEDNENGIKAAIDSKAHVLKVLSVEDVNYANIMRKIQLIEDDDK